MAETAVAGVEAAERKEEAEDLEGAEHLRARIRNRGLRPRVANAMIEGSITTGAD